MKLFKDYKWGIDLLGVLLFALVMLPNIVYWCIPDFTGLDGNQIAAIAGAVKGDIDVRGPVILDASAIVMGNIKSKSVQINNGAVIEGMCSQCYADVSPTAFFDDYKPEPSPRKGKAK